MEDNGRFNKIYANVIRQEATRLNSLRADEINIKGTSSFGRAITKAATTSAPKEPLRIISSKEINIQPPAFLSTSEGRDILKSMNLGGVLVNKGESKDEQPCTRFRKV